MLDLQEVNNTIEQLEQGETTFASCEKLASLYIVREHFREVPPDQVKKEYRDILPSYEQYVETKKRFFLHEVPEDAVIAKTHSLCIEIQEFLSMLYSNTENALERSELTELVHSLTKLVNA